ncbi:MAG: tripartite tricarboxylate transporter substrate binding protein [Burkholderiaceae bacterium]
MKSFLRAVALLLALAPQVQVAHAHYPSQIVRIVVPQAPGGASDVLARVVAQKLGEKWKQPVVVDNRAGAGGNIGMDFVAKAPADGYTLLMGYEGTNAINGSLYKQLPFDPLNDFAPVATLAVLPFALVVKDPTRFGTIADVVSRAAQERLTYGSAGSGSVNHLLGAMFCSAAGVSIAHIAYRGAPQAVQDLLAGEISMAFASMPSVSGLLRQGQLHAVALTSSKRSSVFPEIPTIAEAGFPDFDVNPWFGLFAPAKVPAQTLNRINADVNEILRMPEVAEKFVKLGAEPFSTSPAQFSALLKADAAKWRRVIQASGVSLD